MEIIGKYQVLRHSACLFLAEA